MILKYSILLIYIGILLAIGYFASRKVKGSDDFFIGGKKLGYWVVAFSAQATGESAWLLLGLTGMGALIGVSAYWIVVGEVIGVAIAWFVMASPFKRQTDICEAITIPDYLESRFKSKTKLLRSIAALTLSIFVMIYISSQIDATGSAFESFLGWNYYVGAIVGFIIVVTYCIAGGFVAVCRTDFFQGAVMLIAIAILPIATYFTLSDSANISQSLAAIDPGLMNIWGSGGATTLNLLAVLGMLFIGVGFLGSPQIFVRFMSVENDGELKKGRWVAFLFTFIVGFSSVSVGILGRYLFTGSGVDPEEVLGNGAQNVLPLLVDNTMPLLIVGIYIAAILSAIMSTISSLLILASASITKDIYQSLFRPSISEKSLEKTSRVVTLLIAILALVITLTISVLSPERTIFWFVLFGWFGIAATFCPMMILAIFWRGFTERGAIASMVTGFACMPFFKFVAPNLDGVGIYFHKIEAFPPSFMLALFAGYLVSKIWPSTEGSELLDQKL
jgi:sodium/proline symporter